MSSIDLENFIRDYQPNGWNCAIRNVCLVPFITKDEYKDIEAGLIPKKFKEWYYVEAIKKYFSSQLTKEWHQEKDIELLAFFIGDI